TLRDLPGNRVASDAYILLAGIGEGQAGKEMLLLIHPPPGRQGGGLKVSRFEGLDHDEVACVMDISPRTVNNHIVSALKTLREQWNEHKENSNRITDL